MTNITRWNPFRDLVTMQSAMDRLFEDTWRDIRESGIRGHLAVDVDENDDNYVVKADIPGVNAEDIHVNLHDNTLTIDVEVQQPEVDENTKTLAQERFYGRLSRSFTLPHQVNAEDVEAEYNDGVLTLTLPKAEEAKPRQINVKAGNLLKQG